MNTVTSGKSVKTVIMKCYVLSCGAIKGDDSDVLLFSFPKDLEIRKLWIDFTLRKDPFTIPHARICSAHFIPSIDYKTVFSGDLPRGFRLLKDDAVPRRSPQEDLESIENKLKEESDARVKISL